MRPDVDTVLAELRTLATAKTRDGMARYAIPSTDALGVAVGDIRDAGKRLGRDHALAAALWDTGVYEARMLAAFVDEPARVTPAQMDRWLVETDNWAVCDHACFHLFDRTPHAFACVTAWSDRPEEFVKRGAFALLASLALHDKSAPDDAFLACLPLIPRAAVDERNFVKKGVSWALRAIGRRNAALNEAAVPVARALAASSSPAPRWVGKDALRELTSAAVVARLGRGRG
ncbi:MAG: DNA alkylation repair protein [Pseudomonadota bacterium]|nr:DNA alkylation repair protein [Pseudomonadota bacterium]